MSDFYTSVDMLRGHVSDMICEGEEEHAMWVLADIASRKDASDLHDFIDNIEADPKEVGQFFHDLAGLIDAGLEAEAA